MVEVGDRGSHGLASASLDDHELCPQRSSLFQRFEYRDEVAWCREHLAHYKAPRTVVFGPLPKTSTGKIQKFVLRDRAAAL